METIYGISNWKLTIKRSSDSISILRAFTCDSRAELPDTLFNLPVTELCDYALAARGHEADGEELFIQCGRADGEWNNRNLQKLVLPQGLKSAGRYAFLDCSGLQELHFPDGLEYIGAGAFMNCRELHRFYISTAGSMEGTGLAAVAGEFAREIDVSVKGESRGEFRLVFPEYREVQTENEPTHFFNYTIEGAGYPYHNVFRHKQFYFEDYDALWKKYLSAGHETETAVKLAWYRIKYPVELSKAAKDNYISFLSEHFECAAAFILSAKDIEGLRLLLKLADFSPENLETARVRAGQLHFTEATAELLEAQHFRFGTRRSKTYEL